MVVEVRVGAVTIGRDGRNRVTPGHLRGRSFRQILAQGQVVEPHVVVDQTEPARQGRQPVHALIGIVGHLFVACACQLQPVGRAADAARAVNLTQNGPDRVVEVHAAGVRNRVIAAREAVGPARRGIGVGRVDHRAGLGAAAHATGDVDPQNADPALVLGLARAVGVVQAGSPGHFRGGGEIDPDRGKGKNDKQLDHGRIPRSDMASPLR